MIDWTKPIETVPCARNPEPVACTLVGNFDGLKEVAIGGTWIDQDGNNEGDISWHVDVDDGHFRALDGAVRNVTEYLALNTLIVLIRIWATARNLIEGATSQAQTVKLFEEGGEVAHAVARGDRDKLKDGIGDMVVVLTILAAQNGLTLEECVAAAYDEINDRTGRMVDGIYVRDM